VTALGAELGHRFLVRGIVIPTLGFGKLTNVLRNPPTCIIMRPP